MLFLMTRDHRETFATYIFIDVKQKVGLALSFRKNHFALMIKMFVKRRYQKTETTKRA